MTTVAFPSPAAINTASTTPTLHLSPSSSMRSSTSNSGSSLVSSHLGLRPPMPPSLSIPDIDTSSTSPVPFPRISQRRKLYRGIGTQPWHLKVSDSDSESDESATAAAARKSTKRQQTTTTVKTATPSPEAMPNFDPKRTYSESQIPSMSTPSALSATTVASFGPMIRKKSGEIVKSALKSPSQSSFGAGFGSGSGRGGSSSPSTSASRISMPPTPTFSVRFDRQLEYVRLFRHQQKPAAVSHEGSPCDSETSDNDTFGQQSDGGLYRSSEDERIRAGLVMESVNIPLRDAMASTQERLGDLDVRLDQVVLSSDGRAVEGTVLVRNIAYEKWIAVRFTYDWWQTTSEVTARYLKSFSEENTDVFSFTIRLPEVTKRIDEKRLLFALRYTAGGRECWDNNRGENYHVRFKTEAKKQQQRSETSNVTSKSTAGGATVSAGAAARPPSWPMHANNVDQMAELRKELEKVVRDEEESSGVRAWDLLTVKLRARNMDIEEDRDVKKQATNANANDFSGRYDFKASSKVKWEAPKDIPRYGGPPPETAGIPFPLPSRHHTRSVSANAVAASGTTTTATATSTTPSLQLHQASWRSPRGSPRDHGTDSTASSPKFFIDPREAKHWKAPTPTGATGVGAGAAGTGRVRNHQRGGYFDSYMEGLSKMVFTPPTTSAPRVEEDDLSSSLIAIDLTASSSRDSAITVTATATPNKREEGVLSDVVVPVTITEDADAAEMSSETESTSSSTTNTSSSQVTTNDIAPLPSPSSIAAAAAGAASPSIAEATRAIRFNSYPMDRTYLAVTTSTSPLPSTTSSPSSAEGSSASALLTVPQQASGWPLSPQGSSSSVLSTPSITSASSPSQCPSSPAELSDSMPSIHQLALGGAGGAGAPKPGVDSLDYNYLLQKFCYFTGNNVPDRHGLRVSYGSSHHRHSQSESTPLPSPLPSPTPSPAWDATRVVDAAAAASAAAADISPASLAESRAAVVAAGSKVPVPVLDDDMWSYDSSRTATTATTSDDSGHTTPTLSPKMQMQMRMSMSMTPAHAHAHGTFSPFTLGSPGKRTPTQRPGPADHVEGFDFDFDVDVESTPRPRLQSTEYLVRPYRESL